MAAMTPQTVLAMCRERDIKAVDMRFMDFPGIWQHFTIPVSKLDEEVFEDGLGFDGSSIRGWQAINESDMLLLPQPDTAFVDPFTEIPTLCMICNVQDPITREDYTRDPRNVARKAVNYLKSTGVADTCFIGPEAEFFIFDDVRFDQTPNSGYFFLDSEEGQWNRGTDYSRQGKTEPRLQAAAQGRLLPRAAGRRADGHPQRDDAHDDRVRTRRRSPAPRSGHRRPVGNRPAVRRAGEDGRQHVPVQVHHQERRQEVQQDRHVHAQAAVLATTAPACTRTSRFWKGGQPLFAGNGYAGLSEMGLFAIGGILKHAPAILAFACPTTNSYKRLVPGYEAPVNLAYSQRNRSASCRIPMYSPSPKAKRIEFRCPDPSCNPYLSFATMMMAALDGIQNKIHPGEPLDKDIYDLAPEELAEVPKTPGSLAESLDALAKDHEFLLRGDVFTEDVINTWISYKQQERSRRDGPAAASVRVLLVL